MSALLISIITFALVFGGALLGMYFAMPYPDDHLRDDVRDVISAQYGSHWDDSRSSSSGLLIASAKTRYHARSTQIKQITANIILLDSLLEQYGPDARQLRVILRNGVPPLVDRIWN